MRIPLAAERVHWALAFEGQAPHELLDQRVQHIVIGIVSINERLYPGYIQQVIGVFNRNEDGGHVVDVVRAVGAHRLRPFNAHRRLIALRRKIGDIEDEVIFLSDSGGGFNLAFHDPASDKLINLKTFINQPILDAFTQGVSDILCKLNLTGATDPQNEWLTG